MATQGFLFHWNGEFSSVCWFPVHIFHCRLLIKKRTEQISVFLYEWTREKHNRWFGVAADHVISTDLQDQKFSTSIVSTMAEQRSWSRCWDSGWNNKQSIRNNNHRITEQRLNNNHNSAEKRCRIYWKSWTFKNMALVKMIPVLIILSYPLLLFRHLLHLIRRQNWAWLLVKILHICGGQCCTRATKGTSFPHQSNCCCIQTTG